MVWTELWRVNCDNKGHSKVGGTFQPTFHEEMAQDDDEEYHYIYWKLPCWFTKTLEERKEKSLQKHFKARSFPPFICFCSYRCLSLLHQLSFPAVLHHQLKLHSDQWRWYCLLKDSIFLLLSSVSFSVISFSNISVVNNEQKEF